MMTEKGDMTGLEALQALKDGKMVVYIRGKGEGLRDSIYCYRSKYEPSYPSDSKVIWVRCRNEWAWCRSENPVEFWMRTTGFRVYEEESE